MNMNIFINWSFWIETNTYVGTPRVGSIDPPQPIEVIPGNTSSVVTPTPKVYTNPYACQNLILNQNQDQASAAVQSCPANLARKNTKKKASNEKNANHVHKKNAASHRGGLPLLPVPFIALVILLCF